MYMVKTLTLRFEKGQYMALVRARDLCDSKSWEEFFLKIAKEWRDAEMGDVNHGL